MMARRCYEFQYGSLTFYRFISFLAALLNYFNTSMDRSLDTTLSKCMTTPQNYFSRLYFLARVSVLMS